jgi:hypothetical protein
VLGWDAAKDEGLTIVLLDREYAVADIPGILLDASWARPIINFCRYAQRYGCPWGKDLGWLYWPAAYFEIYDLIEEVDYELEQARLKRD